MSSTLLSKSASVEKREVALSHVVVIGEPHSPGLREVVGVLEAKGFPTRLVRPAAGSLLGDAGEPTGLVVVVDPGGSAEARGACAEAAAKGLPVIVVAEPGGPDHDPFGGADDWVSPGCLSTELPARAARLLKRRQPAPARSALPADAHFFALVVHDLRTPLNVIGLSLRMISQAVPTGDPDLEEDLRFVEENFWQIERMLSQLSDYYRMFESEGQLAPTEFNPKRLVDELLESRATKAGSRASAKSVPVLVDDRDCPAEVSLDPSRARTALQYVLANATAAAHGGPIRLTMRGGPDRWVIEAALDQPAPSSVKPVTLSPVAFERLCGVGAERRGMDLSIAAKVTELFGGSARLEVDEKDRGTRVVLDWPARLRPS